MVNNANNDNNDGDAELCVGGDDKYTAPEH
jgi:hypothetical protein